MIITEWKNKFKKKVTWNIEIMLDLICSVKNSDHVRIMNTQKRLNFDMLAIVMIVVN